MLSNTGKLIFLDYQDIGSGFLTNPGGTMSKLWKQNRFSWFQDEGRMGKLQLSAYLHITWEGKNNTPEIAEE